MTLNTEITNCRPNTSRPRPARAKRRQRDSLTDTANQHMGNAMKSEMGKSRSSRITEKIHWKVDTDEFEATWVQNSKILSGIQVVVRGNPLPLRRHRTSRGFVYNPSAGAQESFRNIFQSIVQEKMSIGEGIFPQVPYPLFASNQILRMTLVFALKRPKKHFVAGRPGTGRLKSDAPHPLSLTKKDIDNLAKFVMDSLNGIAYADDHQIASLQVTKLLDNCDECLGKTMVRFEVMEGNDIQGLWR